MMAIFTVVRHLTLAWMFWVTATLATAMAADPPRADPMRTDPRPGVPTGKGLPVQVKVGVAFLAIESFSENTGSFKATVDLRLR